MIGGALCARAEQERMLCRSHLTHVGTLAEEERMLWQ